MKSTATRPFSYKTPLTAGLLVLLSLAGMIYLEQLGCNVMMISPTPAPAFQHGGVLFVGFSIGFIALGTIITLFQPQNRIGRLLFYGGFGVLLTTTLPQVYGACALSTGIPLPFYEEVLWFSLYGMLPLLLLFVLLPLVFPDGQFISNRWRGFGWGALGLLSIMNILQSLLPGKINFSMDMGFEVTNPFGLITGLSPEFSETLARLTSSITLFVMVVAIFSMVIRWRQAGLEVRQQIKWLVFFLVSIGFVFIGVEVIGLFIYPEIFNTWFYLVELSFFWIGFPLVLALILFKYRLYDIDIIIRRTIQYALLTAALALIYLGSITILQAIFSSFLKLDSTLTIVLSTLAIAALFNPLRNRLQNFIDKRFYRSKYNAENALAQFSAAARDEVDIDRLSAAALGIVDNTMQPEKLSFWIQTGGSLRE